MPNITADQDLVRDAEAALVQHADFGESARITALVTERYRFALELCAAELPSLRALAQHVLGAAAPAAQFFGDPVIRMAMEDAIRRLELGGAGSPSDVERVLQAAMPWLSHPRPPTFSEGAAAELSGTGLGGRIWLLSPQASPGPLMTRLQRAFGQYFITYEQGSGSMCTPGTGSLGDLRRACDLLGELLPMAGSSALAHIAAVGLAETQSERGRVLSAAGGDVVPSTISLAPHVLRDPWEAAGRLLHEGLHLKLFDVSRCYPLTRAPWETVRVPWRPMPWTLIRALVSFHVYAHMLVFHAAVDTAKARLAGRYGEAPGNVAVSRGAAGAHDEPAARFRHLAERLQDAWAEHLTPTGRLFVGWITRSVQPLVPLTGDGHRGRPSPQARRAAAWRGDRFTAHPGLRLRRLAEVGSLLAFRPDTRRMYCLNAAAWAIFERCDGSTGEELLRADAAAVPDEMRRDQIAARLGAALRQLEAGGLVIRTPAGQGGEQQHGREPADPLPRPVQ